MRTKEKGNSSRIYLNGKGLKMLKIVSLNEEGFIS